MPENAENKVLKSLKASPELHRKIKTESARSGEKIETLVERAWDFYDAARLQGLKSALEFEKERHERIPLNFHVTANRPNMAIPSSSELVTQELPEGTIFKLSPDVIEMALQIKPEHIPWVRKLLKVLSSRKQSAVHAVQSNLDVFAEFCDSDLPANHEVTTPYPALPALPSFTELLPKPPSENFADSFMRGLIEAARLRQIQLQNQQLQIQNRRALEQAVPLAVPASVLVPTPAPGPAIKTVDPKSLPALWKSLTTGKVRSLRFEGDYLYAETVTAGGQRGTTLQTYDLRREGAGYSGVFHSNNSCSYSKTSWASLDSSTESKECPYTAKIDLFIVTPSRIEGRTFGPPADAKFDCKKCSYSKPSEWLPFVWIPQ